MIKLDYTLESPEERKALVEKILIENPNPPAAYLEILADYLVLCMEKQERKEKKMLTDNRLVTINKREISFEGLVSQFENGEDGIYNLITENKNQIFKPKISITKKNLEEIPDLQKLKQAIEYWEQQLKKVSGKDAFIIKKTIIELRKDQYIIKDAFKQPIQLNHITRSKSSIPLNDSITINEKGKCVPSGISLASPQVCSAILCNYSKLKADATGDFEKDTWFMMEDFDDISSRALAPYPIYQKIVEMKIDGAQNITIQKTLQEEFNQLHSIEYISSLWRNKIPKLIAAQAEEDYLNWHYLNEEKGTYKKCSRCGQVKLANNKFFSKNKTSKDGFYSICKCCRNKKPALGQNAKI